MQHWKVHSQVHTTMHHYLLMAKFIWVKHHFETLVDSHLTCDSTKLTNSREPCTVIHVLSRTTAASDDLQ